MDDIILEKIKNIHYNVGEEVFITYGSNEYEIGSMWKVYPAIIQEITIKIHKSEKYPLYYEYYLFFPEEKDYYKQHKSTATVYRTKEEAQSIADAYNAKDIELIKNGGSLFGSCGP